jgi:hypothetical protein
MTDRSKKAIAQLMYVLPRAAYESAVSVIETELRLCRAETLRRVSSVVHDMVMFTEMTGQEIVAHIRHMAEEEATENG